MKVFQIINNKCHWDATAQFPTVESTVGRFPPTDLFVEAPEHVREGWGYVDGEFVEPPPDEEDVPDEAARLRAQVAMLQENQTFLENCILEMAEEVYA